MTSQTAAPDGCTLAYALRGSGPPALFVQGVGLHGDGWLPQTQALAGELACLSFDHRGMGGSGPAPSDPTVLQMASDARAVLEAVGWTSAHVVGHSLGGLIALLLALDSPQRVRSLTLMCTFARGRDAAPLTPRMMWLGFRARFGTRAMRRRGFLDMVLPPGLPVAEREKFSAARLAPLFGHDLGDQPPVVASQLRAMRRADVASRLGELAAVPTLVLGAAHDPIAPPAAIHALVRGIPGAHAVEFPDASHGLPITHAPRVNELLRSHVRASEASWERRSTRLTRIET